jgi:hypothetical protein
MGKRELVLIALFAVVGIVVYQFTAPPPPPGSEEVSVGGIFQRMKRQVQGPREMATAESKEVVPVAAGVRLLRISFAYGNDLTIVGSDRTDISLESNITGRGYDKTEAMSVAEAAKLKIESTSDAIAMTAAPNVAGRRNGPRAFVSEASYTINVPKRLAVRLEPHNGKLTIRDVAAAEIMGSRGPTTLSNIDGPIVLSQTGSHLEIDGAGSLKLTSRNANGVVKRVSGTVTMDATGAEMRVENLIGPLDIEARNAEITVDAAKLAKAPFRFNATGGRVRIEHLKTESRIDGRNTDIDVGLSGAAPITIYSTGETIIVTPPPNGYALDAVATEGSLTIEDGEFKVPVDGEQRVSGNVRGGGPALTLRANRGDIRVRKPEGK